MRFPGGLCLLVFLSVACIAQDQNQNQDQDQNKDTIFSTGPQYLVTFGSPLFLHSIATPSLSLAPTPVETTAGAYEATTTSAQTPAQVPDLFSIYYRSPEQNVPAMNVTSEIEVSSTEALTLPASILDTGVTELLDPQAMQVRGYGMNLAEIAAFWKANKPHAARIFTNADIDRLHGS